MPELVKPADTVVQPVELSIKMKPNPVDGTKLMFDVNIPGDLGLAYVLLKRLQDSLFGEALKEGVPEQRKVKTLDEMGVAPGAVLRS